MQEVKLTLPMLPDMELTAGKTASAMCEHCRMSADKIDEVRMAVVEACINAFEHSGAVDRKVFFSFELLGSETDPQGIQITIQDSGIGFDPRGVVEPKLAEKLKSDDKRGWGLEIMKGLMDEVRIRSNSDGSGTTVIMRKMR